MESQPNRWYSRSQVKNILGLFSSSEQGGNSVHRLEAFREIYIDLVIPDSLSLCLYKYGSTLT